MGSHIILGSWSIVACWGVDCRFLKRESWPEGVTSMVSTSALLSIVACPRTTTAHSETRSSLERRLFATFGSHSSDVWYQPTPLRINIPFSLFSVRRGRCWMDCCCPLPGLPPPCLTASSFTDTTITLTITNHTRTLTYQTLPLAIGGAPVPTMALVSTRFVLLHRTDRMFVKRHQYKTKYNIQ